MQFVFVGWCVGIASAAVFEFDVVVFDLARSCPNFFASPLVSLGVVMRLAHGVFVAFACVRDKAEAEACEIERAS